MAKKAKAIEFRLLWSVPSIKTVECPELHGILLPKTEKIHLTGWKRKSTTLY